MVDGQVTASAEGSAVPEPSAPSRHVSVPGGVVTLRAAVSIPLGIAALSVIKNNGSQADIEAGLADVYLRYGIERWTFVDAKGEPEPVTPANIERLLPYGNGGLEVAERADELYSNEVMRPLLERMRKPSDSGPTDASTPPTSDSGSTPPAPSGPSSPAATAGKRSAVLVP